MIGHYADVEDIKITLRKIKLIARMADMGCTERDLEDRKAAAVQALDECPVPDGKEGNRG